MKKLLIKVFCGISICTLFMFVGCNSSTGEETSQEMSTAIITEKATAIAPPDEDILLSTSPFLELSTVEAKKEVSKTESSIAESSVEESSEETESSISESSVEESSEEIESSIEEAESLVESTEESYETKDETDEVEYSYEEEEEYIYEDESYEEYIEEDNYDETYDDEYIVEDAVSQDDYDVIYTPVDFQNLGIINWGGWSWTFYSQQVLPGEGLTIPGRHVDYNGYVCDENDYICLASSSLDKGTVVDTPFGKMGKVYDCGCPTYILDVYVDW